MAAEMRGWVHCWLGFGLVAGTSKGDLPCTSSEQPVGVGDGGSQPTSQGKVCVSRGQSKLTTNERPNQRRHRLSVATG
jgi:hypothetical protein